MDENGSSSSEKAKAFWDGKVAIVLMAHNKCALPIVRELLQLGMHVVGFARTRGHSEILRVHLTEEQNNNYTTREMDMHSIVHMRGELTALEKKYTNVHLAIILIPKIKPEEEQILYRRERSQVLQAMLEIDELSVGALAYNLRQNILDAKSSRCWILRYNHQNSDLVSRFVHCQLKNGKKSKREISVFLTPENNCHCHQ